MATIASKSVKTINVLIAVSAVLAITTEALGHTSAYMLLKPLTTILVTSLVVLAAQTRQSKFKTLMVLAFLFCLLGDILLLFPAYFVYGLAAFLVAHLLFATSFVQLKGFQTHWISFLALYGIGISLFLWLKPSLGDFMVPVGVYVLVICFMAWQGIGLFLKEKSKPFVWIAVAVLLFMFSDTMIAIAKFKADFAYSSVVILSTYWLSIGLIANAARRIILSSQS